METEIRPIQTLAEYEACVELQLETWGRDFGGCVPVSILMVTQRVGGITAGAFGPDGELLGCIYGITGLRDGRPVHWSDILAVRKSARGTGLGKRLKFYQREELLKTGVETMLWTYDPLQALNANLNLNALGARAVEYVVDMYGDTRSDLHDGLGTDRFVVQWDMASERVRGLVGGKPHGAGIDGIDAPIANTRIENGRPEPIEAVQPETDVVRIEIPNSINEAKAAAAGAGSRWRACTRRSFRHYFDRGLHVVDFISTDAGRHFYIMRK